MEFTTSYNNSNNATTNYGVFFSNGEYFQLCSSGVYLIHMSAYFTTGISAGDNINIQLLYGGSQVMRAVQKVYGQYQVIEATKVVSLNSGGTGFWGVLNQGRTGTSIANGVASNFFIIKIA